MSKMQYFSGSLVIGIETHDRLAQYFVRKRFKEGVFAFCKSWITDSHDAGSLFFLFQFLFVQVLRLKFIHLSRLIESCHIADVRYSPPRRPRVHPKVLPKPIANLFKCGIFCLGVYSFIFFASCGSIGLFFSGGRNSYCLF